MNTGAPWSLPPSLLYLVPAAAAVAWRPRDDLVLAGAAGFTLAWLASQLEPAWSPRYLFVLFGPVLLVLARRPAWAVAPLLAAMVLVGPAAAKSNARAVAVSVAQRVRPGDLVVVTQSPWARAVRRRTREWRAVLHAELRPLGATSRPDPGRFRSTVRAEIFEVLR